MVLSGTDRFVGLVQFSSLLVTCIAIAGIARRLGISSRGAVFGSLVFATLPVVALQAPTALNDIVVAALLAAATLFALGEARRTHLLLCGLSVALAVGAKATAILALPLAVLVAATATSRARWAALAVTAAAGSALGAIWYVAVWAETGSPDGGIAAASAHG